jgi:Arc/MetJ-type ribon-helix-helix transcriptional regulator
MATFNVTLPDPLKARAEHLATAAGFESVDDYVANLLETVEEVVPLDPKIEALVLEGLNSGPSIPWTPELMKSIMENARRDHRQK